MKELFVFLTCLLPLIGCAAKKYTGESRSYQSSQPVTFSTNYEGKTLTTEPVAWKDYYDGGTWLYRRGKFEQAMKIFEKGAEVADGEARRLCLLAATVSALAEGSDWAFMRLKEELKAAPSDPFTESSVMDDAIEALERIHRMQQGERE